MTLIERLDSHMGKQDIAILLADCREAAARIQALEADVIRLQDVMERCAVIVDRNLYHQHEKIEGVPKLLRAASRAQS